MTIQILVAPAAFKGTLGPRQVAEALSAGVRRAVPEASLLLVPIADGGDGLLDAVLAPGALREQLAVTGPLGAPVRGVLGWVDAETAIFESATASGLALLRPDELDPLRATTRGVGELIWEATERGAKVVVVGLGGTATVDGGTGAGRGLGWTFLDARGEALPEGGGSLAQLAALGGGRGRAGVRAAEGGGPPGGQTLVPRPRTARRSDGTSWSAGAGDAAGRRGGGRTRGGSRVLRQGPPGAGCRVGPRARGL